MLLFSCYASLMVFQSRQTPVKVIGAGLAGSELAWQLAQSGIKVELYECRPHTLSEAHHTGNAAELVCSNSLKSNDPNSAPGMLKAEMQKAGSLILSVAAETEIPGGQSLTVDRERFSAEITKRLKSHPLIEWIERTVTKEDLESWKNDFLVIIATGPLTSESITAWLAKATTQQSLYFYDAIAPIVDTTSIDFEKCFLANRYGKGQEEIYLNCPLDRFEYERFIDELLAGEKVQPKNFEKEKFFQGCQPIEAIASTGRESLRFGPMKPVGLTDPKTGRRPYAVVQLRPENLSKTAYNMVGFQTKLKYSEQKRIFRLIPALRNAEFFRLGSIHRNTFVNGPLSFNSDLSLKSERNVFLAGQITGVEGYLESAACGLIVSFYVRQRVEKKEFKKLPKATALGALYHYLIEEKKVDYQPMNINFSLFEPKDYGIEPAKNKSEKEKIKKQMALKSLHSFEEWMK